MGRTRPPGYARSMLLCEDLLLLLTDDDTGKTMVFTTELRPLLAGALLTDLALAGHVRLTEKGESIRRNRVVIDPDVPVTADPLLAETYERLGRKKSWSTMWAVQSLTRMKLERTLWERLVAAELVSREEQRVLGVFPVVRHRQVDPSYERGLTDAVDRTLIGGDTPDDHTAALIGLLHAGSKLIKVADRGRGIDRAAAKRRARDLMKQHWAAKAAYDVITANRAAAAG